MKSKRKIAVSGLSTIWAISSTLAEKNGRTLIARLINEMTASKRDEDLVARRLQLGWALGRGRLGGRGVGHGR